MGTPVFFQWLKNRFRSRQDLPDRSVAPDAIEGDAPVGLKQKVARRLDGIRPSLQADGGDAKLVRVDQDGTVFVQFVGACRGCPMSTMTLQMGIEQALCEALPEVQRVVAV